MSSKRQSERAAARYVVEKLHKIEELNDDFRPTPSVDSDDDEIKEEKKSPIAGFYKNEVEYTTIHVHYKHNGCIYIRCVCSILL